MCIDKKEMNEIKSGLNEYMFFFFFLAHHSWKKAQAWIKELGREELESAAAALRSSAGVVSRDGAVPQNGTTGV